MPTYGELRGRPSHAPHDALLISCSHLLRFRLMARQWNGNEQSPSSIDARRLPSATSSGRSAPPAEGLGSCRRASIRPTGCAHSLRHDQIRAFVSGQPDEITGVRSAMCTWTPYRQRAPRRSRYFATSRTRSCAASCSFNVQSSMTVTHEALVRNGSAVARPMPPRHLRPWRCRRRPRPAPARH